MSDELKAAIAMAREGFNHGACPDKWADCNAARTICDAYLAEHDSTPIDPDWLKSVGFVQDFRDLELLFDHGNNLVTLVAFSDRTGWKIGGGTTRHISSVPLSVDPKTRGDLRKLCSALGVPLKEGP